MQDKTATHLTHASLGALFAHLHYALEALVSVSLIAQSALVRDVSS